jgi:hypothetical protein
MWSGTMWRRLLLDSAAIRELDKYSFFDIQLEAILHSLRDVGCQSHNSWCCNLNMHLCHTVHKVIVLVSLPTAANFRSGLHLEVELGK